MVIVCVIFVLSWLWTYPLTFWLRLEEGRWRLYFLPRVFGGYGRPRLIPLPRAERDLRRVERPLSRRMLWRLTRSLLAQVRVEELRFLFIPGYGEFSCIFALSCGDSIAVSLSAAHASRRGGRRGRWQGKTRSKR